MPATRSLVLLLVTAALVTAAEPAKVRTLTGKEVQGELVGFDQKEITVRTKDGNVKTPFEEVLDVDLQPVAPPAGAKYVDVELIDGTLLHCAQFSLKNKDVELKLLAGQDVKLPLAAIGYVLNDAQDKAVREEWKEIIAKQGNRDIVAVKTKGKVNGLEGTLGEGDAAGTHINFELRDSDQKVPIKLDRVHGLSFFRKRAGNLEEPLCKLIDTAGNILVITKVKPVATGYVFTTGAGVDIEYPAPLLAKLDFSKGKLTYLSDLDPMVKETSALEGTDHFKRDKNLDGGPLRLAGTTYSKGLAVPATTELVFNIGGDYKEFKAILGFDDQVGGDSNVKILVEGDNRELFKTVMKRGDKKTLPLVVDVKNVKSLRIVVSSADLLDLGYHINFADAKVSK